MQKAGKLKVGVFADAFAIETGKECGGGRPVKTLLVVKNSYFQCTPQRTKNSADRTAIMPAFLRAG